MKRTVDRFGIAGIVLLMSGAAMFLTSQSSLPLWITWIVGPLAWYFGFALVVVWGLYRIFGIGIQSEEEEVEEENEKVRYFPSNFLEHDFDEVPDAGARRASA